MEVHIHKLRDKIGRDKIETVRGLGYRMRPLSHDIVETADCS